MDSKASIEGRVRRLGGRLFDSPGGVQDDIDLLATASTDAVRLAETTGETVALALMADDEAFYVDETENHGEGSQRRRIGQRVPLWINAIGRALAASLTSDARQSLLERIDRAQLAEAGFATHRALAAHLDLVRARGYAIEVDEASPGVSGVAAPILDRQGRSIAAIGIEGPSERLPRERLHELGPLVVEATRNASQRAGGAPRPMSSTARPSGPPSPSVATLADTRNLIGEAPVYDRAKDRLFWVDMYDPAIYRFDRASRELATSHPGEMVTALALVPQGLLVAAQSGLWLFDPDTFERVRPFGDPEGDIATNRFNDGKCDRRGRFWVNTMDYDFAPKAGALYRLGDDGAFATMETGLSVPNGMGWSPDEATMYLADTAERTIYAYDFRPESGEISNRRVFVRMPEDAPGAPDGLDVDDDGNVYVAIFDGWRISRYSPIGVLVDEIVMPVPRPTSCVVGGPDNKTLFVTSARIRISQEILEEAPLSGAVLTVSL